MKTKETNVLNRHIFTCDDSKGVSVSVIFTNLKQPEILAGRHIMAFMELVYSENPKQAYGTMQYYEQNLSEKMAEEIADHISATIDAYKF